MDPSINNSANRNRFHWTICSLALLIVVEGALIPTSHQFATACAFAAFPAPTEKKAPSESNILFLNIDQSGNLVVSWIEIKTTQIQFCRYVQDQFDFIKRDRGEEVAKEMRVVVRADSRATFERVYWAMRAAKDAGFTNVQLHAQRQKQKKDDKEPMREEKQVPAGPDR